MTPEQLTQLMRDGAPVWWAQHVAGYRDGGLIAAITLGAIAIVLLILAAIGWRYAVHHREDGYGNDTMFWMSVATIVGVIVLALVVGLAVYNVWVYGHPDLALWQDKEYLAGQLLR